MARYLMLALVILSGIVTSESVYYGKLIGEFTRRGLTPNEHHDVTGTVYAVDDDTLQIVGFTFDGNAPDTFFWIGTSDNPSSNGETIPKAKGIGNEKLGSYSNMDLVIHLDETGGRRSISQYKWISIWCKTAQANFADVFIPSDFTAPEEFSLGRLGLNPVIHGVTADDVVIVNSKQIRFERLNYDGEGPDAYFWLDTRASPSSSGTRVPRVGQSTPTKLPRDGYPGATITVQLPQDFTVFNIRNIGLWCVLATQNFGHVNIPQDLETRQTIVPYSLAEDSLNFRNCEVLLDDEFQVSWTIDGEVASIRLSSREPFGNYMGFGLSGSDSETQMVGSDVAVAWVDSETGMALVEDYYLSAQGQCVQNSGNGACPDTLADPTDPGEDDVTLSGYFTEDAITHITYRRPLNASDQFDKSIQTSGPQYISWALGPTNSDGLATYHRIRTQGNQQIDFGMAESTCPAFTRSTDSGGVKPFSVPAIRALENATFRCDIGQAGGRKGYQGITGQVGWGISWYIDGNLIPEITVKRGQTYTFNVYGGMNPNQSASYHPLYITTDAAGGYYGLDPQAQENQKIIAGPVDGSYCSYERQSNTPNPDEADSYSDYRDTLQLTCPDGEDSPGILVWTPDKDTPDLVYYQCYTHRFLGWKINVSDDATRSSLSVITVATTLLIAIFSM